MEKLSIIRSSAAIAASLIFSIQIGSTEAFAAKEQFVRDKLHVNIGTIGQSSNSSGKMQNRRYKAKSSRNNSANGSNSQAQTQFQIQLGTSKMQNAE